MCDPEKKQLYQDLLSEVSPEKRAQVERLAKVLAERLNDMDDAKKPFARN